MLFISESAKRELKDIINAAIRQGFTVEKTNGGHVSFKDKKGKIVIGSSTPSDGRGNKNLISHLRALGYVHIGDERREKKASAQAKAPVVKREKGISKRERKQERKRLVQQRIKERQPALSDSYEYGFDQYFVEAADTLILAVLNESR